MYLQFARRLAAATAVIALACTCQPALAGSTSAPVLGGTIADFTLNDYLGAKRSLSQWKDAKAVVVVFLGTECPLAKLYGAKLAELDKKYAGQGVQFVGVNANQQDTLQEIAAYAHKHGIEFPVLKDAGAKVADQFGATRTPEAFVLDAQRVVRYHGRIDDQFGVGSARNKAMHNELVDAIDALLAGKPVDVAQTEPIGCLIGRREPSHASGEVTYAKDIAPILQQRCVTCHRTGQIAPFALTEYDDVTAWADTMLEVIDQGRMPPWHANPHYGEFRNDARMPDAEKELVHQWVAGGAPEGDLADLPAPREYPEGWQLPKPYTVFQMPEEVDVPATGTVPYQYYTLDPHFTEDKWVSAAEGRPGNREVVHHLIMFYLPPGQDEPKPGDALFNAIAAFAPGMPAVVGPPQYSLRIPAGSKLIFQMHYTPNGHPQKDRSEAAVVFADPAQVTNEVRIAAGINVKFLIPPFAPDYRVNAKRRFDRDTMLYTLTPHMHYRGKSFRFTADYPDGREEILLDVPRYDFNWQNIYLLKKPKLLPAGTVVHMEGHFDNSPDNPLNPNPSQAVFWGDQTWDEMMLGSMTVSSAAQDVRLRAPQVEQRDGANRVHFRYRPADDSLTAALDEQIDVVYLAGSFNEWKPEGLKMDGPDGEGFYTAAVDLPKGRYEYKFVVNGKEWKSDPGNSDVSGVYGNSVLTVE